MFMHMRLQPYDLKIVYQPGAEMYIADALSRLSGVDQDEIADLDITIQEISSLFTSSLLEEIRTATNEDDKLRSMKEIIYVGWPQSRSDVHRVLLPYWNFRDELSIDNGIVTKGTRIVIPRKICSRILAQLHLAHQGVEKTRLHARTAVYWPGMYDDIEQMVKACSMCQEALPEQPKEPMIPSDVPCRLARGTPSAQISSTRKAVSTCWYLTITPSFPSYDVCLPSALAPLRPCR